MPELRPYQKEDVLFLEKLDAAGIFNQMRTGKSPTALITLVRKKCSKNIIVAPASTLYQWKEEYERWTNQPCIILAGTPKKVDKAISEWTHGAVISYDLFKDTSSRVGKVHQILKAKPDAIVLDEAHKIKNPKTDVSKSVFLCTKIPVRLALTGTPAPNKPHEIYSILHFLKPETYKSYWGFIDNYFYKYNSYGNGRTFLEVGSFKRGKELELQKILAEFCTSRKRKDVMQWLPEKDYINAKLDVTKEQSKYLNELAKYFETEHIITQGILDRLMRYRQICLDPEILELKGKSPKFEYITQYIKDNPNEPILIFSKFNSFLYKLEKFYNKNCRIINGTTTSKERNQIKCDFQKGKFDILLLQIDATKEGLTLDRAETIIFADKYPPVSDLQQAEDRFVATTEARKNKPHTVISLMMKDTYDEVIEHMIKERKSETDIINNFKEFIKRSEIDV